MPFWCVCPYPEQHMRFRSGWHGCSSVLSDKLLGNQELMINEKGEPSLKRLRAKAQPAGLLELEEALHAKIPERYLLDVVVRIERLTGFGRHLGPLSGNEPKADDAWERQILAIFAYGTNYVEYTKGPKSGLVHPPQRKGS